MPLSARFSHIVFPHELARRHLVNVATLSESGTSLREPTRSLPMDERRFVTWLFAQAGLDAHAYRPETLARRLGACFRALRVTSSLEARQLLERFPAQISVALDVMLVGVTSFFRDPAVFDMLSKLVFPNLAKPRGGLYVWSAGCSDGAELYSVAMLLQASDLLTKSYLLGTDCREDAIAKAKRGVYVEAALSEVPLELRQRCFTRLDSNYQVARELRNSVRWRVANVLSANEPGLWDVVMFRNTAIYLRTNVIPALWQQLEASLRPGGILVLGKAERPIGATRLQPCGSCLYRKTRR